MNSAIIDILYSFILSFVSKVKESKTYGFLTAIHSFFVKSFSGSVIVNWSKTNSEVSYEKTSIFCRILRIPITLFELVSGACSKTTEIVLSKSLIFELCKTFFNACLTLNFRFFGLMIFSSGLSMSVLALILGVNLKLGLLLLVFGLFIMLFKINLSDYINSSIIVNFIRYSFNFSEKKYLPNKNIDGRLMAISAVGVGIISGILGFKLIFLLALPIALFFVFLVFANPVYGVYLTIFSAPILPTMAIVGLCMLTVLSAFFKLCTDRTKKVYVGGVGYGILLLLYILTASSIKSFARVNSFYVLSMYFVFICFYFVIRNTVDSKEKLNYIMKIFAISAFLVSAYGIMQYAFGWTTKNAWIDTEMFEDATMRVYSTLKNPNVLGEYLLLALPICAFCFISSAKNIWSQFVYACMFLCVLFCLILTQSRGCWIGFVCSLFVFVTYYKSSLWKFAPFAIILLLLVMPQTMINRFMSVGNMSDSSTSYRVYIWLGTLAFLKIYWFSGIGLGENAFNCIYPFYAHSAIVAPHSHNLYLQLIVESGIISLIVFGSFILIFFKNMIDVCKKKGMNGIIAAAFFSGIIGFLVQSMFDYTFYNYRVMGIFFMVLSLGSVSFGLSKLEVPNEKNN